MARYIVQVRAVDIYDITVDADTPEDAATAARELYDQSESPDGDFSWVWSDVETETPRAVPDDTPLSFPDDTNPFHPESPEGREWETSRV